VKGRPIVEWALLVAALWLLGGAVGLMVAVAFVVYDLVRQPAPRDLQVIAILLLGLVPLVVLARGLPAAAAIGTDFVQGNLVAHNLAGAGLALLVVGVLREIRAEAPDAAEVPAAGEPDREAAR
jgi:hypothetical protein